MSKLQNEAKNYSKKLHETSKRNNKSNKYYTNQGEWNNIIKALNASAEKNLRYNQELLKKKEIIDNE